MWWHATSLAGKIRGLFGAAIFAVTEYTFYMCTIEHPDGTVMPALRTFPNRPGHTTKEQFAVNMLLLPVLLDAYIALVKRPLFQAILWPVFIWVLEVVEGYFLMLLYGYNPAWQYRGRDAFCHGNIKLGYWKFWVPMGLAVAYIGIPGLLPLSESIAQALKAVAD